MANNCNWLLIDNTIRITQWKASVRNDRALLDCLEIIQQLGNHRDANVSKDLQYIIDTTSMYKASPQSLGLVQQLQPAVGSATMMNGSNQGSGH